MASHGWFDAHLDLAYLAEAGRDMTLPAEAVTGPKLPAAITLPALAEGNVRTVLGTIFIQKRSSDPTDHAAGLWTFANDDEAFAAAMRQVAHYQRWQREGRVRLISPRRRSFPILLSSFPSRRHHSDGRRPRHTDAGRSARVRRMPACGCSLCAGAKVRSTRAAIFHAATSRPPAGRLVAELDRFRIIHDVSHLSEEAFWTLFKIAKGPVIASHSNCRALLPSPKSPDRHLSDDQIRALADRGGVIGIVLYSSFLVADRRATIADVLAHIEHIEKLTGRRDCIALGSDADGGFSAAKMPEGLDHPRKYEALATGLKGIGWSEPEIDGFRFGNWERVFREHLP